MYQEGLEKGLRPREARSVASQLTSPRPIERRGGSPGPRRWRRARREGNPTSTLGAVQTRAHPAYLGPSCPCHQLRFLCSWQFPTQLWLSVWPIQRWLQTLRGAGADAAGGAARYSPCAAQLHREVTLSLAVHYELVCRAISQLSSTHAMREAPTTVNCQLYALALFRRHCRAPRCAEAGPPCKPTSISGSERRPSLAAPKRTECWSISGSNAAGPWITAVVRAPL